MPVYYGWVIVGVAFWVMFVTSAVQLWGFGAVVIPMQRELGWATSAFYLPLTVRSVLSALGAPFFGRLMDLRHGAAILLALGGALNAVSLFLASRVHEQWQFMALFGVLGGIASLGQAAALASVVIPKWFIHNRGRAVAIATAGSGTAGFVAPLGVSVMVEWWGWRGTWIAFAIITLALTVPLAALVRRQPEDIGLQPKRSPVSARPGTGGEEPSRTSAQAVRTVAFWLVLASQMLAGLAMSSLPASAIPLFVSKGYPLGLAAAGLSVWGGSSIVGRFFWSALAEGSRLRVAFVVLCLYLTGVILALQFGVVNSAALLIAACLSGFGIGGAVVLNTLVWPHYFGRRHLGAITGATRPFLALSSGLSPYLVTLSFDRLGTFRPALMVLAAAWTVAACLFLAARRPPHHTPANRLDAGG